MQLNISSNTGTGGREKEDRTSTGSGASPGGEVGRADGTEYSEVRTNIIDRALLGHVFCNAGKYVHGFVGPKQRSSEVGIIAYEKPWIKFSVEQVFSSVLEQCFCETLKANALVYIA